MRAKPSFGLKAAAFLFLAIAAVVGTLFLLIRNQESDIAALESSIAGLEAEAVPLRFMVLSRDGGEIRFRLRLYDRDGTERGSIEEKLPGESLFIDFVSVPLGGAYLAFPRRVFTERIAASDGLSLFPLYDSGGFPAVFDGSGMGRRERKGLAALFGRLKSGDMPRTSFGSAVHDVKELSSFEIGVVYKAVSRKLGGLEILEDER